MCLIVDSFDHVALGNSLDDRVARVINAPTPGILARTTRQCLRVWASRQTCCAEPQCLIGR